MAELGGNQKARPHARFPVMLETAGFEDYALVDSGDGQKLERYGAYRIVRPEPQAMWRRRAPIGDWESADAVFTGGKDEEADGRWRFPKPIAEEWPMRFGDARFLGRFTSFRHVGVFPEQAAHWTWIEEKLRGANRPTKVLNLFGYTGVASLLAAKRRRGGDPCRRLEEDDRLGAREPGGIGDGPSADPLALRRRDEVRPSRGAARQSL